MGLFSLFRKNQQASASDRGAFFSRGAGESSLTRAAIRQRGVDGRKAVKAGREDPTDPILPEKKRARRRLIGAVALVLAVVIALPMLLDSEPRPLADDVAIHIPSKEGKERPPEAVVTSSKEEFINPATLAANTDKPAIAPGMPALSSAVANGARPESAPPAQLVPDTASAVDADAKSEVKVSKSEARTDSRTDVKARIKPVERKEDNKKGAQDMGQRSADASEDSARALAILEGKSHGTDKKSAPGASGGRFVIQVAALASQEKIDELRAKLSSADIETYTQKVATQAGERIRIRVGPFASREEADKIRVKINKLGLNATIIPA